MREVLLQLAEKFATYCRYLGLKVRDLASQMRDSTANTLRMAEKPAKRRKKEGVYSISVMASSGHSSMHVIQSVQSAGRAMIG